MGRQTISRRVLVLAAGCVIGLLLTVWILVTSVKAQQKTHLQMHQAFATRAQGTPAVDPTVAELQKENLQHQNNWFWNNTTPLLSTLLSIFAVVFTALFSLYRWRRDQRIERERRTEDQHIEREKRDEERFQAVVTGLGSEKVEARVGAAIMLRTFLQPNKM